MSNQTDSVIKYQLDYTWHHLGFHPLWGDAQAILQAGSGLAEAGQNVLHRWWTAMQSFGVMAQSYARDLSAP